MLPLPVAQAIGNVVALVGLLDGVLAGLSAGRVAPHLLPLLASAVQVSLSSHGFSLALLTPSCPGSGP